MGRNLWQLLEEKVTSGPMSLTGFMVGFGALASALILSAHDFNSSLLGLRSVFVSFQMQQPSWGIVMYTMALLPQIGQVVFLFMWSLDTDKKRWLYAAIFWFVADFLSDVQYWTDSTLFPIPGVEAGNPGTIAVSGITTLAFYTIGSEMLLIAGSALVITLYPDAKREWARLRGVYQKGRRGGETSEPSNQQRPSSPSGGASQPPSMLTGISFNEPPRNNRPQGREARQRQGQRNGTP